MTSHYEEYKAKLDELYKNGVVDQSPREVDEYLQKLYEDAPMDNLILGKDFAVRKFVEGADMQGDEIVFPEPDENGCYPVKFIAALHASEAAVILDLMGRAKYLLMQPSVEKDPAKTVMALLRESLPLFQRIHRPLGIDSEKIEDIENVLIRGVFHPLHANAVKQMITYLPKGEFMSVGFRDAIEKIHLLLDENLDLFSNNPDIGLTYVSLKKYLEGVKRITAYYGFDDLRIPPPTVFHLLEYWGTLVFAAEHKSHCGAIAHFDDLMNAKNEIVNAIAFKGQCHIADKFLEYLDENMKRLDMELNRNKSKEKLQSDIDAAMSDAVKELESKKPGFDREAPRTDWEIVRNVLAARLAKVLVGFHRGTNIRYSEGGEEKSFLLPTLNHMGVETYAYVFNVYNLAFDVADRLPAAKHIDGWNDIKFWLTNAKNFFQDFKYLQTAPDSRDPQKEFIKCRWNTEAAKCIAQLDYENKITDKLNEILEFMFRHKMLPQNEFDILNLMQQTCNHINSEVDAKIKERLYELLQKDDNISEGYPTKLESVFDKIVCLEDTRRELEKIRETEVRNSEREEIFSKINHNIKNINSAVFAALAEARRIDRGGSSSELLRQAYNGSAIISGITEAISMSYRRPIGNWRADLSSTDAKNPFVEIIRQALYYSIPQIFIRGYSRYLKTSVKYFPSATDCATAEAEWFSASGNLEKAAWLKKYLGDVNLSFDAASEKLMIGDEYNTAIHFFIMFNELFGNAIKAVADIPFERRQLLLKFQMCEDTLSANITNSAINGITDRGGAGKIIIDNYIKMFGIEDYHYEFEEGRNILCQHFTISFTDRNEKLPA